MKYQEWLINWLNNYIQPSSKQRTYTRYSEIVNQHIIPKLGELDLNELTPFTLQCFVTELLNSGNLKTGKGLSPNSVNAIITVMQNSLKTAYALGYMNDYTADKIKRPKTGEKKVECFSSAEQKKMEQYIMSKDKPKLFGVFLCLYTGLRIGELLALEWTDIDFVKGELRVNKTCHDGKNQDGVFGRITDIPKTQSSVKLKRKATRYTSYRMATNLFQSDHTNAPLLRCRRISIYRIGAFILCATLLQRAPWNAEWT